MNKKIAKSLIREFRKVHAEYSMKNDGHFKKNWKSQMQYADLKNGHWYWKGYDLAILHNKYGILR